MGGTRGTIKAKTKTELRRKYEEASVNARAQWLTDVWNYDLERVKKTKDGYEIIFYAHS